MAHIRITLVKSTAACTAHQIKTVQALGLTKLHSSVEREDSPCVRGQIKVVSHLVSVETI